LLYVAMTRAKEHLHLMIPQRFHVHQQDIYGDRHVYATLTRFIPNSIADRFERRAWPVAAPASAAPQGAKEPAPKIDVAARIRALWR
jgi:DNA helicase II / ATP-dependent DNA helicase PcrA